MSNPHSTAATSHRELLSLQLTIMRNMHASAADVARFRGWYMRRVPSEPPAVYRRDDGQVVHDFALYPYDDAWELLRLRLPPVDGEPWFRRIPTIGTRDTPLSKHTAKQHVGKQVFEFLTAYGVVLCKRAPTHAHGKRKLLDPKRYVRGNPGAALR